MSLPFLVENRLLPRFDVDDALMDVHRRARFLLVGLRHEGRVDVVAQRGLAHGALEEERLVGQRDRIAVIEIHLDLRHALFVDQAVDADLLRLAIIVDVFEQRIEFVDRVDAVSLPARLRAARLAGRRQQRIVGIDILGGEEEFELRRHDRPPAALFIELHDALQDGTRRMGDRFAVLIGAIADDLRRRLLVPGHDAQRFDIGNEIHVRRLIGEHFGFGNRRPSPSARRSIPAAAAF